MSKDGGGCDHPWSLSCLVISLQVQDEVRDGLRDTLPRYNGEGSRNESITDAWDEVQDRVSAWDNIEWLPGAVGRWVWIVV